MGRGVHGLLDTVPPAADDPASRDDDRTDGHVALVERAPRLIQCRLHEMAVEFLCAARGTLLTVMYMMNAG